ncbi:MAG: phage portal protein, partial [Gaiellaceae bacterium]|nr:phage portal protein [Gaiellaceae bacterium]
MIAKTRHGNVLVEQRDASLGALLDSRGLLRSEGTLAGPREVAGLPAWTQAIRIASEAIAKHKMRVWRGEDGERRMVTTTWQARFFMSQPNEWYSWFQAWEWTEASLTARWNAFWLKEHDPSGRVVAIYVLHPDDVQARLNPRTREPEYQVVLAGQRSEWLSRRDVLHFRVGAPAPGSLLSPTPIEQHRRSLAAALARQQAEAEFYEDGNRRTTAVIFPADVTPQQAERFRQLYLSGSSSKVKVFGGDPRIETIGLSLQDQQFIESQAFTIDDIGRILGVPPSLLWSAAKESAKPLTPEHEEDRWVRYGLEPRRQRIEQTIAHDPSFFGPGARDYPAFQVRRVRGDALTESSMVVREVQAGIRTPNEGRAELGLPPLPEGDILQITPVG